MLNTTVAHYKITAKLGQGGMGEVYRATDTKLGREVAIKVLPEALAGDAERLARFQREAELLASLNHPNIAAIHGLEESGGSKALVLELVEGETLADRLKKGSMVVEDALETCLGIAEALEAAHEKGIIHRDLKPANVKFTSDGKVKVLDFGLAKALDAEPESMTSTASMSESPTITADYTKPGTILGTAAYMSPEQARGKALDKRTDIWSFGCVLFECLTGKKLFQGEDVSETLAKIIQGAPDWGLLPTNTPPTIQLLLRKCLAKDRKRRLPDIAAARIDLAEAIDDPNSSFIRLSEGALQSSGKSGGRPLLVGAIGVLTCGVLLGWFFKPNLVPEPPARRTLDVKISEEGAISVSRQAFKLSPDGTKLVYSLRLPDAEYPQLFLRQFDQLVGAPIAGTLDASHFCISPDGSSLAFRKSGDGTVYKVPISGGTPHKLFSTKERTTSFDWTHEEWIIYGELNDGLYRVASGGGPPEPLTLRAKGERSHQWPHVLPGGQAVLYSAYKTGSSNGNLMVQKLTDGKAEGKPLLLEIGASQGRYVASGHLLFMKENTLFGVGFDADSLKKTGQAIPVLSQVLESEDSSRLFDISADGSLVYLPGEMAEDVRYQLEWIDRAGKVTPLPIEPGRYRDLSLSPDREFLAYSLYEGEQSDIWTYHILRGFKNRESQEEGLNLGPIWSPNGQSIVFTSFLDGFGRKSGIYWKAIGIGGKLRRVNEGSLNQDAHSWHPEGHQLIVNERGEAGRNVRVLDLEGDEAEGWKAEREGELFRPTEQHERDGTVSPDGNWLAMASGGRGGNTQIYVYPYKGVGKPIRISVDGLRSRVPKWLSGEEGKGELVFSTQMKLRELSRQVYIAKYEIEGETFKLERNPVPWEGGITRGDFGWDIDPDGSRLLVSRRMEETETKSFNSVMLFQNFIEHLKKEVPRP